MRRLLIAVLVLALPSVAVACLWDYDTLKQERSRFPDTLEIITGKFLRHSPEFYEWRIKDRLARLKTDPSNPALHDDLAVAYAKTGQYAKAIATMEALEKIAPGRYETYSNLGTFHFLAGDIPKALPIIDKALAINPDAHFGREKYQRWLGEYLLSKSKRALPVEPVRPDHIDLERRPSFDAFVSNQFERKLELADYQAAVKGVLGMMRFANHENPILLEALGDLLVSDTYSNRIDAKRLAARAYLKAGTVGPTPEAKAEYARLAKTALHMQTRDPESTQMSLEELESEFRPEQAEADRWYADLKAKEFGWIADGADPEAEFDKLYTEEPWVGDKPVPEALPLWKRFGPAWIGGGIAAVGLAALAGWLVSRRSVVRR